MCGANPSPGVDWTSEIRLVEGRPRNYSLLQTNFDNRLVLRARLRGSPPWRMLATFLATNEKAGIIDIEAAEEFESSGLEDWQETALFICWLRSDEGTVNHGAQFLSLSDEEVRKVCAPYADPRDWRRLRVFKLWNNLNRLLFPDEEDQSCDSIQLKDTLDRLDCWNSPDPVSAAIELLQSQKAALNVHDGSMNECADEVPNEPPKFGNICFGRLVPQDTLLGISWNNITARLTLENWATKALVRKGKSGWLYLWVAQGHYSSIARPVYQIRTASERRDGARFEKKFWNLEDGLAYANGEDEGDLAKETSPATSARDYPPRRGAGWHIQSGQ